MSLNRLLRSVAVTVLLVGAGSSALAQAPDDPRPDRSRDWASRMGGRQAPLNIERLVEAVKEQLEVSEEQLAEIRELADEYNQRLEDERHKMQENLDEQREQMRELFEEKMAARRAHDSEREKEIEEQINALRPKNLRQELEQEFISRVEEILDEGQREQFRTLVTRMRNPGLDPARLRTNPSLLRTAVTRLDLDEQQRVEIDELWTGYWQEVRELDPTDRQGRDQLAVDFYERVTELLTEEQNEQLKSNPLGPRPPRPPRASRGPHETDEGASDQPESGEVEEEQQE